jgi:hypothetical protein
MNELPDYFNGVVDLLTAYIEKRPNHFTLQAYAPNGDEVGYVQALQEHDNLLLIEAVNGDVCTPPLSEAGRQALIFMGWRFYPESYMPNYAQFIDQGLVKPREIATIMARALHFAYGVDQNYSFEIAPQLEGMNDIVNNLKELEVTYLRPAFEEIQEALIARTMRAYPHGAPVVKGSTPVVSFGNPFRATVVTLGINPSYEEFQDSQKNLLVGANTRLVDHQRLAKQFGSEHNFEQGLNREQALEVVQGCHDYFNNRPYQWFTEIERVALAPLGLSYEDQSAAHLDVIQWATDPVWSQIEDKSTCQEMLNDDANFLHYQLESYDFRYILMNGKTVIEQVKSLGLVDLQEVGTISFGHGNARSKLWKGHLGDKTFLGWNLNIQRHEATSQNKAELTQWLQDQVLGEN